MANLDHTASCIKARESRQRAQAAWRRRWPDHCPTCEGNTCGAYPCAGTQRGDPRELMALRDDERGCLFQLWCPRCGRSGAMHPEDASLPCKYCGWVDGGDEPCDAPNNGYPPDHECACRVAKRGAIMTEQIKLEGQRRAISDQIASLERQRRGLR